MGRMWRVIVIVGVTAVISIGVGSAGAQQVEQASSPYQGEFEYRIGDELRPQVSIDGVLIDLIQIAPRDDEPPTIDSESEVEVTREFTNTASQTTRVLLVILLEDEQGNALERLELPSMRIGKGKTKDDTDRMTLRGRAMLETRKVYLYCELQ